MNSPDLVESFLTLSYDEVVRFKHSVITSQTHGKVSGVPYPTGFTQCVDDNCSIVGTRVN